MGNKRERQPLIDNTPKWQVSVDGRKVVEQIWNFADTFARGWGRKFKPDGRLNPMFGNNKTIQEGEEIVLIQHDGRNAQKLRILEFKQVEEGSTKLGNRIRIVFDENGIPFYKNGEKEIL